MTEDKIWMKKNGARKNPEEASHRKKRTENPQSRKRSARPETAAQRYHEEAHRNAPGKRVKRSEDRRERSAGRRLSVLKESSGSLFSGLRMGILLVVVTLLSFLFGFSHRAIANRLETERIKKEEAAQIAAAKKAEEEAIERAFKEEPENVEPEFNPHSTQSTEPSNLIEFTGIRINDEDLSSVSAYQPDGQIDFGTGIHYSDQEGILCFRGNNFRNSPTYGTAEMKEFAFGDSWTKSTGSLGSWSGSGWTGQPLMMKWPSQVKQHMNMYDSAKAKEDLVEVIYATMDGNIYFLDLETGEPTRAPMSLGFTFKGAGALDPRGYPIMYLGAGINSDANGTARAFIINLLDCSVMYSFGNNDPYSLRGALSFFDSSALVDAETDTLIYPGENGILYLMKLNTQYDEQAGTLSINPQKVVRWRYNGTRSNSETYWWGMEDSACIYRNYLFIADNGGNLMCLDLNTLQLVWVQDVLDDTNDTPVLSVEDGHLYLYISTSFHLGWRSYDTAEIPIWKIDAETGEIVWKRSYNCHTIEGVSGGVQSTIALGKRSFADYIYVTVSMTDSIDTGVLACINKKTGEVEWEHSAFYAWSSPVCVYNSDGSGAVIYCTSQGEVFMLDGLTGEVLSQMQMNGNVEASPAVYNDRMVVGTRDCMIYGVQLK